MQNQKYSQKIKIYEIKIYNCLSLLSFKIMITSQFKTILIFLITISIISSVPTLPEGIHSIVVGQFQQNAANRSQQVMTYYDVNQDEHCDVITIATKYSSQDKSVQSRYLILYLWDQSQQYFVKQAQMNLSFLNIASVICTQFYNRDIPETDIVLTYTYVSQTQSQSINLGKKYAIQFIKSVCNQNNGQCKFQASFQNVNEVQIFDAVLPSVIMLQGKMSLIFRKNNEAFVFNFNKDETGSYQYQVFSLVKSQKYLSIDQQNTQISSGLSYQISYFGDYNGDGIADLIISQKFNTQRTPYNKIHFFKYDKSALKFVYDTSYNLKELQQSLQTSLQFFSLQDFNYDGRIDLILLFKNGLIQIHYNKIPSSQTQLVSSTGFAIFPFDLYDSSQNYVSKIQRIKFNTSYAPISSAPLVFGDFNLDGYEEIIIDFEYPVPSGQVDSNGLPITKMYQKSIMLSNQKCSSASDCGDASYNPKFLKTYDMFNIRKFTIFNNLPVSYKTNESFKLSFIDLYKDGRLDLLSIKLSPNTAYYSWQRQPMRSRQIQIYYNNVHYDAFFMKVRVMRGDRYEEVHQNLPIVGGNVNCFVTSLGGQMLPKVGNQFAQVGRMLQLPYVFFGLGRTNNYVNQLTVTIPYISQQLSYQFMWTPLIPNSQIVTLANPQGKWQLTTFIQPTKKMGVVALLTILSLIGIGIAICRLSAKQKNQDKENLQSFYTILR